MRGRGNVSVVAGLIPAPQRRPRTGFPWFGLMIAIVLAVAGAAYLIGGVHGAILAGVLYGTVVMPIVFLISPWCFPARSATQVAQRTLMPLSARIWRWR